jgi:hypothetical protein
MSLHCVRRSGLLYPDRLCAPVDTLRYQVACNLFAILLRSRWIACQAAVVACAVRTSTIPVVRMAHATSRFR